jgi:hypothetical protein
LARLRLAIASELIGAERKGERGQPRIVRRVGETVRAGRQQRRQSARPEHVFHRFVGVFQTEQDAGQFAVGSRHKQKTSGLGLVTSGAQIRAFAVIDDLDRLVEIGGGDEQNRHRSLGGAGENGMHRHSAASRMEDLGA